MRATCFEESASTPPSPHWRSTAGSAPDGVSRVEGLTPGAERRPSPTEPSASRGIDVESACPGAVVATGRGETPLLLYWPRSMPHCEQCHREVAANAQYCSVCGAAIGSGQAPDPDSIIGRTLKDTYFIERHLGTGGMGHGYRALHVRLGKPVAVKILQKAP